MGVEAAPEPAAAEEPKRWEITTTAQVERTYHVEAKDAEQAHKRLRAYLADPDSLREGVVSRLDSRDKDTTPQKTKGEPKTVPPRQSK